MRLLPSLLVIALTLPACMYSFVGGGLPPHIDTIAVLPFENGTAQPLLESEIENRMQQEIPRNLGVQLAAEDAADAVIRGRIIGYDEAPASVRPTGQGDQVPVLQRQVRINFEAEIYDMREDQSLWRIQGRSVVGNFAPDSETPEIGRSRAVQELVQNVIDGAQSQW